jgi:hypothetical protein
MDEKPGKDKKKRKEGRKEGRKGEMMTFGTCFL